MGDLSGIEAQRDEYLKRLREAQAEADRLRGERDHQDALRRSAEQYHEAALDRAEQAEQALQRAVGALGDLVQFAQQAHTDWTAEGGVLPGTMKRLRIAAERGASITSKGDGRHVLEPPEAALSPTAEGREEPPCSICGGTLEVANPWFGIREGAPERCVCDCQCERCLDCGGLIGQAVGSWWQAPDDLWRLIWGDDGGVLCPRCFTLRAVAKNVSVYWLAMAEMPAPSALIGSEEADLYADGYEAGYDAALEAEGKTPGQEEPRA